MTTKLPEPAKARDDDDDTFIDGITLRRLCGGRSHMWVKRQAARHATFPKARYVNLTPFYRLGDLRAWWASLPTVPPPSQMALGAQGVEVLKEARARKKAQGPAPPEPTTGRKPRLHRVPEPAE
jgi:hypothetical protein